MCTLASSTIVWLITTALYYPERIISIIIITSCLEKFHVNGACLLEAS
jgi:hypothetical protein